MNFLEKDINYKYLVNDIMSNDEFNKLSSIPHHGETRLEHSIKVSYFSYKIVFQQVYLEQFLKLHQIFGSEQLLFVLRNEVGLIHLDHLYKGR